MQEQALSWDDIRDEYPTLRRQIYLNAAGMTPIAASVRDAGNAVLEQMCDDVRHFATGFVARMSAARSQVAAFYGAKPEDIGFVQSSSLGLNMIGLLLQRQRPDRKHIVSLESEFPSTTWPLRNLGFEVSQVALGPGNRCDIDRLLAAVRPGTAAVAVSYVQFGVGTRLDALALSHALSERGVPLVLNATQAAGVIPIDVSTMPLSAMVVSGNKWLMAGPGTCTLYLSEPLRKGSGFPPLAGWMSSAAPAFSGQDMQLSQAGSALEVGLQSLVPVMCLQAAISWVERIGVARIHARVMELSGQLLDRLLELGATVLTPADDLSRSGIVSVERPEAQSFVATCETRGIVTVLRGNNTIRISPHIYNNEGDIEAFIDAWTQS